MPETGVARTLRLARDARTINRDEPTLTARANVCELGRFMLGERYELTPRGRAELRAIRRARAEEEGDAPTELTPTVVGAAAFQRAVEELGGLPPCSKGVSLSEPYAIHWAHNCAEVADPTDCYSAEVMRRELSADV